MPADRGIAAYSARQSFNSGVDLLKREYPDEAGYIEGLRRYRRVDLIEHAVLNYREAKRLYNKLGGNDGT